MNMPRLYYRELRVAEARIALADAVIEWAKTDQAQDLTDGEYVAVVVEVLSSRLTSWAKYAIRQERHPDDPDRPGGFE